MSEQDDPLFVDDEIQRKLIELLSGDTPARLSIAYVGPALTKGRIDAVVLADGLKGTARFVNRVAEMHLGTSSGFYLEVEGEPRAGSFEVFLRFAHAIISSVDWVGDSKFLTGLAIIATLTGFNPRDAGKSLLSIFKRSKGRPITDETDLDEILPADPPIDKAELIRIFNDPEVQAAIRGALRPLRKDGVERFETRAEQKAIETVSQSDLVAADAAEMEAIIPDETKVLEIEKASFVEHLAWHLSDEGKPFDAKIEDPMFWKRIAAGDRFGFGDRMHATLHTEAERESDGRLKVTRTITKIHRVEHSGGGQTQLFESEG